MFDWKIKCRVAKKTFKAYTNQKGSGHLLNIDLIDEFGDMIQGTFFGDKAIEMNDFLEESKIYFFSDGRIKLANTRFTSIKNEFCIVFDNIAQPVLVEEDDKNIKHQVFNFTTFSEIS